ncbi:uncharacterized protein LY89DRAFT_476690 [Mollisia scopiformis]|uniref:Uncharacterized protein n=1 Tax=Mollisia scopiformis TaxID=149040 RepID=A0A194XG23_MOLSC|nr:uncharacterized protein LY89DRAFT_476690 [Mollisia scopiformis]KUJ19091.1 hypothetical protein LY89DRAFT_476690 [Mollisia scopiformis]
MASPPVFRSSASLCSIIQVQQKIQLDPLTMAEVQRSSRQPTKLSNTKYVFMFLETLPWALCLLTSLAWIFLTKAPSSSVLATFLWLAPMAISQVASISFLIYHGYGQRSSHYHLTEYERAILDCVRSSLCSLTLSSLCMWIIVFIETQMISKINPLRDENGNLDDDAGHAWAELVLVSFCLLILVGPLLAVIQIVPFQDAKRVRKARSEKRERLLEEGSFDLEDQNGKVSDWEEADEYEETIHDQNGC